LEGFIIVLEGCYCLTEVTEEKHREHRGLDFSQRREGFDALTSF